MIFSWVFILPSDSFFLCSLHTNLTFYWVIIWSNSTSISTNQKATNELLFGNWGIKCLKSCCKQWGGTVCLQRAGGKYSLVDGGAPSTAPYRWWFLPHHTLSIIHTDTETTQRATVPAVSPRVIAQPKFSGGKFNPFRRKLLQVQWSLKTKKQGSISWRTSKRFLFLFFLNYIYFPFIFFSSFHFLISFSRETRQWVWEFAPRCGSTPNLPVHTLVAEWQDFCRSPAITSATLTARHVCTNARGVITSQYTVRKVV